MKQYTTSFDYNIPAEFTTTNHPDRWLNISAVCKSHNGSIITLDWTFKATQIVLLEIDAKMAIYQQIEELARKKLQVLVDMNEPVVIGELLEDSAGWVNSLEEQAA